MSPHPRPLPEGEGGGEGSHQPAQGAKELRPKNRAARARQLRGSSTDAERKLWSLLRSRQLGGAKFRRQHRYGSYILDFFCLEHRLAIEADGAQHLSEQGLRSDNVRTNYLELRGIRVLRYTNREILLEGEAVLETIRRHLESASASGEPSP